MDPILINLDPAIDSAIEHGKELTQLHKVEGYKPILTNRHFSNGKIDLVPEKLAKPRFLTAAPLFNEVTAFIQYLRHFQTKHSRIFYQQNGVFIAVIDYHESGNETGEVAVAPGPATARHGDHLVYLKLLPSPEWAAWISQSGQQMDQLTFAEFLEDHAADLLQPGIEDMLAVATGLQGTTGATFRSAFSQANGAVKIQWDEDVKGTVLGKEVDIPTTFQVGLRPFMGCCRYPVDCRFRWRAKSGEVKLHFKAMGTDPIIEAATDAIVKRIAEEAGITPALGEANQSVFTKGI